MARTTIDHPLWLHIILWFAKIPKLHWYMTAKLMVKYLTPLAFFDINMKCFQSIYIIFHNIFLSFLKASRNEKHVLDLTLIKLHSQSCLILNMYPLPKSHMAYGTAERICFCSSLKVWWPYFTWLESVHLDGAVLYFNNCFQCFHVVMV